MLPVLKQLIYQWEKATNKGSIYSPLYSRKVMRSVGDEFDGHHLYYINAQQDIWLKAEPIQGLSDQFAVHELVFEHHRIPFISGSRSRPKDERLIDADTGRSHFSLAELPKIFADRARLWERTGLTLNELQPFKGKFLPQSPSAAPGVT